MDILLVEDNPSDAELTLLVLRRACPDLQIKHLEDGAVALRFLKSIADKLTNDSLSTLPKLLLLDLKLPKLDGLDLLRVIQETPSLTFLPVVIFTSSREERDLLQAYRLGVNSYVIKPVNFDELKISLLRIVEYWLQLNVRPVLLEGDFRQN